MIRFALLSSLLFGLGAGGASAFEQPPVQSPQDQACRDEAAGKVFQTPDPDNVGPYVIGKGLYLACMQRAQAPVGAATPRRPRKAA